LLIDRLEEWIAWVNLSLNVAHESTIDQVSIAAARPPNLIAIVTPEKRMATKGNFSWHTASY